MLFRIWLMNFDIYFRVAEKKDKYISKIIAFIHLNVNRRWLFLCLLIHFSKKYSPVSGAAHEA